MLDDDASHADETFPGPRILRLFVVRHGETEWSLSGRRTASTDLALTANGEREARELLPRLAGITFSGSCAARGCARDGRAIWRDSARTPRSTRIWRSPAG